MRYFDHDTTAGRDLKVTALRMECGGAAVDAYWTLLELMYEQETDLNLTANRTLTKSVCLWLGLGYDGVETLENWVKTMVEVGLLERDENDPETLYSERVRANISAYKQKCETARQNGRKGGRKPTSKPTGNRAATDVACEGQAKKRKEKKVVGSYKKEPTTTGESVGADAENSAPPSSQTYLGCPHCGSAVTRGPNGFVCKDALCFEVHGYVEPVPIEAKERGADDRR